MKLIPLCNFFHFIKNNPNRSFIPTLAIDFSECIRISSFVYNTMNHITQTIVYSWQQFMRQLKTTIVSQNLFKLHCL